MTAIALPANTWVNLYSEAALAVGVPVSVDNIGDAGIYLSAVATKIADANPLRQFFRVDLDPGLSSEEVYIRLYPTSTDNVKQGIVISRISSGVIGVRNFFELNASVSGYAGEISAITNSGDADIFVTGF